MTLVRCPDEMQGLQVELISCLRSDELHRRTLYRLGNRIRVSCYRDDALRHRPPCQSSTGHWRSEPRDHFWRSTIAPQHQAQQCETSSCQYRCRIGASWAASSRTGHESTHALTRKYRNAIVPSLSVTCCRADRYRLWRAMLMIAVVINVMIHLCRWCPHSIA
jgi:hypothetical protein